MLDPFTNPPKPPTLTDGPDAAVERMILCSLLTSDFDLLDKKPADLLSDALPVEAFHFYFEDSGRPVKTVPEVCLFADMKRQAIFEAAMAVHRAGTPPNLILVGAELERRGHYSRLYEELMACNEAEFNSARWAGDYIAHQAHGFNERRLTHAAEQAKKGASGNGMESRAQELQLRLLEIQAADKGRRIKSLAEVYREVKTEKAEIKEDGVKMGFPSLDSSLGGFSRGQLILLAGRPGQGKSALLQHLALHASIAEGVPTLFLSLEMSAREIMDRISAAVSGTDHWKLRKNALSDTETHFLDQRMGRALEAPLWIADVPNLDLLGIQTFCHQAKAINPFLGLLAIDYIQLVKAPGRRTRYEEVGAVSKGLKVLAKMLKIPIVAAAQLKRVEKEKETPKLSDLRESGDLEQDADVVLLLHRTHNSDAATLRIGKNRSGALSDVPLRFIKEQVRFEEIGKQGGNDYQHGSGL